MQLCHSPILRTCCEVSQNSAIKYSSGNNSPFLFAMVLPPESNRTLMSVFLPSIIHADNSPVLVSVTKINCHLTHIHPSHIVIIRLNNNSSNNNKKKKKKKSTRCSEELHFSHSTILQAPVRFYFPYSLSRHPSYVVFFPQCTLELCSGTEEGDSALRFCCQVCAYRD